jgi:diguanylate cyclase (GGDEF)-like protein/PAS domain S-box-containing protein
MGDRAALLESALDSLQEGIVLFTSEGNVAFWNQAAKAATGYAAEELIDRAIPDALEQLAPECLLQKKWSAVERIQPERRAVVQVRHRLGHEMRLMARKTMLHDESGERIGTAVLFHPAETLDALPRGVHGNCTPVLASQAEFKEHLRNEFDDCIGGGLPFGVLWIKVDQAEGLNKTHGAGACQAMLEKMERALATGLRPAEILGRWGADEFLVISHERTAEMLTSHARLLVGLARIADFKWWGDQVTLSVSIGAAQACPNGGDGLEELLRRAQQAMEMSAYAGGNRATAAQGGYECS